MDPGRRATYLDELGANAANRELVSLPTRYPYLAGLRPDLYRCFMEQTWRNGSRAGAVGLVHPETHFTDEKAGLLRSATYPRLRRHWQFINELRLFEIHNLVQYGVHVYRRPGAEVCFLSAASLYHPDTVERSLLHDGSGEEPGLKDSDGNWDLRPHAGRIIRVTDGVLDTWHAVLETDAVPTRQTRMLYTVNRAAAEVLDALAGSQRIGSLALGFSLGWDEGADFLKGLFEREWGVPESWDDVIMQGPHVFVATPFYKTPRPTMKSNKDWVETDLEALDSSAVPETAYKPKGDRYSYDAAFTDWGDRRGLVPARDHFRVAWRAMAANTGERTLIPAVIPPGTAHVDGVNCLAFPGKTNEPTLAVVAGFLSSILSDFSVRAAPKSALREKTIKRLPIVLDSVLRAELCLRVLRLNCLTGAYATWWSESFKPSFKEDMWAGGRRRENRPRLGDARRSWTSSTPLRIAEDRRQALLEIDALVALMLGVTADELCTVYRTQFAVLYGYDRAKYVYDANGRVVPTDVLQAHRRKGDRMTAAERTSTNQAGNTYTYELPFRVLDREADMRQAYAHFERILAERTNEGMA